MAIPLALGAGGILGSGLLRNLALQGGITALSAGLANPDAARKALGSSGRFFGDVGGNLVRDVLGTQPPSRQIGGIPAKDKYGNLYRSEELRLGAQARADQIGRGGSGAGGSVGGGNMGGFIPPGATSTPFANPAAERAYQSERSSVAQQAAQNPELQRYQDQALLARQALQGYDPASGPLPGAAQTAQDMGMAMWAKANPGLAAKVRPGQSGFGAIQNTLASSAATSGLQMPNQLMSATQTPSPVPFPTAIPQSGLQIPNVFQEDQLSTYPQFDPKKVDIGLFSKFMQANPKK
jgi:hypothetical protein